MNFLSWLSICIPDINIHMFVSQLLYFLDDENLPLPLLTGQASNIVFESFQDALTKLR